MRDKMRVVHEAPRTCRGEVPPDRETIDKRSGPSQSVPTRWIHACTVRMRPGVVTTVIRIRLRMSVPSLHQSLVMHALRKACHAHTTAAPNAATTSEASPRLLLASAGGEHTRPKMPAVPAGEENSRSTTALPV
jgi:hypothetical protein